MNAPEKLPASAEPHVMKTYGRLPIALAHGHGCWLWDTEGKKYLEGWIGNWTAKDATFTMGDQKMVGSLKNKCEKVSNGWGVVCKATFAFKGMPPMTNTFMMGWDLGTAEAHMFEVSDAGEVHNHSGKWTDDKSISLVHQGKTWEGKDEKDACTATWNSPKELKLDCTGTQGGATTWTFTSLNKK